MSVRSAIGLPVLFMALLPVAMSAPPLRAAPGAVNGPPNIVLIVVDTLRADHLGCYGYARPTSPHIDRLAAEGTLFERCESNAAWTFPACVTLFTGVGPLVHGCTQGDEEIPRSLETLGELLGRAHYNCAAVISNPALYGAFGFGRGFAALRYDDFTILHGDPLIGPDPAQADVPVNEMVSSDLVTHRALGLVAQLRRQRGPFFLFLLYFDVHDRYMPPRPHDTRFDPGYTGPVDGRGMEALRHAVPSGRDLAHLESLYDGEIAWTDAAIGQLLRGLDDAVDPRNTLVVLVADHGEAFGEHGCMLHGNSAHVEETRTPMIWRWPGVVRPGRRVDVPVSNADVLPTLAEVAGRDVDRRVQGRSLWPALARGAPVAPQAILTERANARAHRDYHVALSSGRFRLHARFGDHPWDDDARFDLFDLAADPREMAGDAGRHPVRFATMKESLIERWRAGLDLRDALPESERHKRAELTREQRERLGQLPYVR